MSTRPHIRPATPDDLPALAVLAERTFRQAFGDANDPADFEAYAREAFSKDRLAKELADAMNTFVVVPGEIDGELSAYAKVRRASTESCCRGQDPIELERIYVDQARIGRGVGALLMEHCLELAAREGHDSVWLGVWERNERAIAFYRRWGFEVVGEHDFQLGSDLQRDLVMERRIER